MRLYPLVPLAVLSLCSNLLFTGCGTGPALSPTSAGIAIPHLHGKVHGGQQPVYGATVQLYAASTAAAFDGAPATPLITSTVTTLADGSFDITGDYSCPSSSSLVYLVGTGGNPGLGAGVNNAQLSLLAALGACGQLTSSTYISINELTTVAAVRALAPYMRNLTSVGATVADSNNLAAAFDLAAQLADSTNGTVPGNALSSTLTAPIAAVDTLADILATCVNSAGGVAGDRSNCGLLFLKATPPNGTPPANTADAALDIVQNPGNNVADIYNLATATGPFQPTLNGTPINWQLRITPNMPEPNTLLAQYLFDEGSGTVAADSSGNGNDATLNGPLWEGNLDLNFPVIGEYVAMPAAVNAARSFQFAIYNPPYGFLAPPQAPGYGLPTGNFAYNPSLLCGTDQAHLCLIATSMLYADRSMRFYAFNTDHTEASTPMAMGWHVFTITCGSSIGTAVTPTRYYFDGLETGYIAQGGPNTCPTVTSGNYQIGGSSAFDSTWFLGKVAATWAWSSALSPGEANAAALTALAFLHAKGISTTFSQLPSASPLILGGLDSRTFGVALAPQTVWIASMSLTDPDYKTVNLGFPGGTLFDACYQYPFVYGPYTNPGTEPTITIFWGGVNDILLTYQSSAQIAASMQCLVQQAKAAGSRVIVATEVSSYGNYNGDPGKNSLDPLIRANAFSWGADNIADLATDPLLGADGAYANSNCFVDRVHLGPGCEPHVTAIMQNAVNELIGSTLATPTITGSSTYQELAGDRFLTLTASSPQSVTLPDCIGYSLSRYVQNNGAFGAAITTLNGETLTGTNTIAAGASATLTPTPGPVQSGGCSWTRSN